MAIVAGLVGSLIGGLLSSLLSGDGLDLRPSGLVGSLVGALVVTAVWRWDARNTPPAGARAARRSGDPRNSAPALISAGSRPGPRARPRRPAPGASSPRRPRRGRWSPQRSRRTSNVTGGVGDRVLRGDQLDLAGAGGDGRLEDREDRRRVVRQGRRRRSRSSRRWAR